MIVAGCSIGVWLAAAGVCVALWNGRVDLAALSFGWALLLLILRESEVKARGRE